MNYVGVLQHYTSQYEKLLRDDLIKQGKGANCFPHPYPRNRLVEHRFL